MFNFLIFDTFDVIRRTHLRFFTNYNICEILFSIKCVSMNVHRWNWNFLFVNFFEISIQNFFFMRSKRTFFNVFQNNFHSSKNVSQCFFHFAIFRSIKFLWRVFFSINIFFSISKFSRLTFDRVLLRFVNFHNELRNSFQNERSRIQINDFQYDWINIQIIFEFTFEKIIIDVIKHFEFHVWCVQTKKKRFQFVYLKMFKLNHKWNDVMWRFAIDYCLIDREIFFFFAF